MPPCEGGYKYFKIGDLFEVSSSKSVDKSGLDLSVDKNDAYQFIGRTRIDNGVQAYTKRLSFAPNPANTFSIIQVGESVMQYRESPWYSSQNIFLLKPTDLKLCNNFLYIVAATNKALNRYNGGYNDYPTISTLKKLEIYLPVTKSGEIDFQYIEERMRELEEERMRELEAYLAAAGFANCDLTPEEQVALRKFSNGEVKFTSCRIGDHFKKLALGKHKFNKRTDVSKIPTKEHTIPLVNAKHGDNGIMFYGKPDLFEGVDMTIDIVQNGAVATGDVYAQPQTTSVLWDAYLIKRQNGLDNESTLLYSTVSIGKSIKFKYGYDNKATWERVQNDSMILPTTPNGEIDYDFMETYISAIKKQIIARLKTEIAREHKTYESVIND